MVWHLWMVAWALADFALQVKAGTPAQAARFVVVEVWASWVVEEESVLEAASLSLLVVACGPRQS